MLQLLLVRHAVAEERETFEGPDEARPLTSEGRKKMVKAAHGLAEVLPAVDCLVASPYLRAAETAAILARAWGNLPITTLPTLTPESEPAAFVEWLRSESRGAVLAAVGHEPHLSRLLAFLICGRERPLHRFKKGGAVLVEFAAEPKKGSAEIAWALPPRMLRELA